MRRLGIFMLLAVVIALVMGSCGAQTEQGLPGGNLHNGGFVYEDGEGTLYFTNFADGGRIYAKAADGTLTKLNEERSYCIQRAGDWIYYKDKTNSGIARVRLDGSEQQRLSEDDATFPTVWGDWIYYISAAEEQSIWRVAIDGSVTEQLSEGGCAYLNVTAEGLYYTLAAEGNSLYFSAHDGSGQVCLLEESCAFLNIAGGWAYYIDRSRDALYRWELGKTDAPVPLSAGLDDFLVVSEQYIVCMREGELWRMDSDGTDALRLAQTEGVQNLFLVGEYVYYHGSGADQLVALKLDGSDGFALP